MNAKTVFVVICLYCLNGLLNASPTTVLCPRNYPSTLCQDRREIELEPKVLKTTSAPSGVKLYVLDHKEVVYNNARLACKSHGMEMAIINNAEENEDVYLYLSSLEGDADVWTAGNDNKENGKYIWGTDTNSPITFFDWITGSAPKDPSCGCISIIGRKKHCEASKCRGWQESNCNERRKTLCMLA